MIEGESVRLRGLELTDVDVFMKHWNNLDLRNLLADADRGPVSRTGEEEWVRNTWRESAEKKGYTFAIETIQDKRMIGGTSLMRINWTSRSALFGISIYNPQDWGRRFGREAARLLVEYAFNVLNLNRIELEVLDNNERAMRCYRAVGFKEVGRRRKSRYVNGEFRDEVIMDLLREEWMTEPKSNNLG